MAKSIERTCGHDKSILSRAWSAIHWGRIEQNVRCIQERIFRATRANEWRKVKNLQKLIVKSYHARLIAVKRVTQDNKGKKTAGIDGKLYLNVETRMGLVQDVALVNLDTYKPRPVKRVYIPKPSKTEKRPLGIPTMKDRVLQTLVKMALEPEWEAKFEPNSFGFRPGRRAMDAVTQIRLAIGIRKAGKTSPWMLDADISKCFDTIDHDALLKMIMTFKKVIRRWLKAGAIEFGRFYKTRKGTPQGGVISPLLANIALDGMERLFGCESYYGVYKSPNKRKGKNKGISLIRYADDFVVCAPSREIIIKYVIPRLRIFLQERGLIFNDAKTRIVRRDEGLDFLGFNIRQFGEDRIPACLIRPSRKAVRHYLKRIKLCIDRSKQVSQHDLISFLNPIIRGWAQYYKYCNVSKLFFYMDYRIWKMLWHWSLRRHSGKSKRWIKQKYFPRTEGIEWVFKDEQGLRLELHSNVKRGNFQYAKVKGNSSPYDSTLRDYWTNRHGKKYSFIWP